VEGFSVVVAFRARRQEWSFPCECNANTFSFGCDWEFYLTEKKRASARFLFFSQGFM